MESIVEWISFALLILIIIVLAYMFVQLVKLSNKLNDLRYYVQRPHIPFEEKASFPYTVTTPSKYLL